VRRSIYVGCIGASIAIILLTLILNLSTRTQTCTNIHIHIHIGAVSHVRGDREAARDRLSPGPRTCFIWIRVLYHELDSLYMNCSYKDGSIRALYGSEEHK